MLDTHAVTNGESKEADALRAAESISPPAAGESVEALEEALAAARARLQHRLADDIEAKQREIELLRQESDGLRSEASTILAQANETAERMLRETNETTQQALREATDAAEQLRRGANEAADQTRRQVNEAAEQVRREAEEKNEAAERCLLEARESAAAMLARAEEAADTMLTRVRGFADTFFTGAAAEMQVLHEAIAANDVRAEVPQSAVSEERQSKSAEKDGPSKGARERSQPAPTVSEHAAEAVVTRMVVHPLVGANTRSRIKERFESLPGIQAVKLGPAGDETFELLVIHSREATVLESVLAVAPKEIVLKDQKVGYLELELKDLGWVEAGAAPDAG